MAGFYISINYYDYFSIYYLAKPQTRDWNLEDQRGIYFIENSLALPSYYVISNSLVSFRTLVKGIIFTYYFCRKG